MKGSYRLALFMVAAGFAGCGQKEAPLPEEPALEAALDALGADALRAHYEYLADDAREGRLTGTPGYDDAAAYVAQRFEALGLEPGGEDGWYQQVPLQTYQIDNESVQFVAHRDSGDRAYTYRKEFAAYGDIVREETAVSAEVVYAGFGVHAPEFGYSDYDGVDVAGKIIAIFDGAPPRLSHNQRAYFSSSESKYKEAVRRGVVGVILLRSRLSQENYPWERVEASAGTKPGMTWLSAGGEADGYHPELLGKVLISEAASESFFSGTAISFEEAIEATEASRVASVPLGFKVTLSSRTSHDAITSPNVVGIVRGTDPELASEYVVYTGHLDGLGRGVAVNGDEIYNGAYDNAMGIALLLETARVFAADPPRRSVMFLAVTGEEKGLLGSDYYAHYPTVPIEAIVANINLDMPVFTFPVADIIAFGAEHSSLAGPVDRAAPAEGFTVTPDPMPQEVIFIRSDQYSFVKQGVPSIFLVPGFGSTDPTLDGADHLRDFRLNHYHRPSDDLSLPVDWDSAVRFARANTKIGYDVADDEARPAWNEGDFFGEMFARKP
jgi:hypothetical protein